MIIPEPDTRSPERRALDEQIASEPHTPYPDFPPDVVPKPLEVHLAQLNRKPVAFAGVVENGIIRLLDPSVKLPERARVVVVAAAG